MNLIIIGPQGCGKGTQAEKLAERFGASVIEMGHIFRDMAKEDTELGRLIHETIHEKKVLVSNDITIEAFKEALKKISDNEGVVLDGIPRTMVQVESVGEVLDACNRNIDKVISIVLPREISLERITKRFACRDCRKRLIMGKDIQNIQEACPDCGGEVYQRSDDSPEGVSKRLDIFYKETVPVIEYYREKGLLVEVDGKGSIEEVFNEIVKKIRTTDYH